MIFDIEISLHVCRVISQSQIRGTRKIHLIIGVFRVTRLNYSKCDIFRFFAVDFSATLNTPLPKRPDFYGIFKYSLIALALSVILAREKLFLFPVVIIVVLSFLYTLSNHASSIKQGKI